MHFYKKNIAGTFIQPKSITDWREQDYDLHFKEYKELGFDHIILQWTEYYDIQNQVRRTYYPSDLAGREMEKDLLTSLLRYCEKNKLKAYIGLNINDQWWEIISGTPAKFDEWWRQEALEGIKLADDIWSKYNTFAVRGESGAFGGWYISFEVDNLNFNTLEKQNILSKYYNLIIDHIHNQTRLPVMISPFFNRAFSVIYGPKKWSTMWENILSQTSLDIIALQDGIGCKREFGIFDDTKRVKAIKNVGKWFEATREAIKKSGKNIELWSDVETFIEEVSDGKSKFSSAPLERIISQIEAERPFVNKFTSFSFQAYQDFDKNEEEFKKYKRYLEL